MDSTPAPAPQPTRPPLPKWLPTAVMVLGGLNILGFIGLTVCIKTLDWPGPIPWKMLMGGLAALALGAWLQSRAKPAN